MTPVSLPRSREERLTVDGRDYRIFVAWPVEPPPPAGYPVFYVLDANAAFATVVEAIRMRSHRPDATHVWPAIVVGVGYDTAAPYERVRRTFDYTQPDSDPTRADGGDGRAAIAVGGGPRFLAMLRGEVTALVARDWPLDPARRTLVGHSLAGYFVLHTLVTAPHAFATYIAMSPSIWWDHDGLHAGAAALAATRTAADAPTRAYITVGEYEQALAPWQRERPPVGTVAERRQDRRMVDHARALAERLAMVPGLQVRFDLLAGQDHASVVPVSLSEGVRFAFGADATEDGKLPK